MKQNSIHPSIHQAIINYCSKIPNSADEIIELKISKYVFQHQKRTHINKKVLTGSSGLVFCFDLLQLIFTKSVIICPLWFPGLEYDHSSPPACRTCSLLCERGMATTVNRDRPCRKRRLKGIDSSQLFQYFPFISTYISCDSCSSSGLYLYNMTSPLNILYCAGMPSHQPKETQTIV